MDIRNCTLFIVFFFTSLSILRWLLSIFRRRKNETQSQQNKITNLWDQLPLEMKQAVVKEMSVRTRVNLSMCSKADNQLVRGTKYGKVARISLDKNKFKICLDYDYSLISRRNVVVEPKQDGGSNVYVNKMDSDKATYSTTTNWKETIWNIMGMIGTKVTVELLELAPDNEFQELFNWFRKNFHIEPRIVMITALSPNDDYCDESIFHWPSNTQVELFANGNIFSNLERFNAYEKIVRLVFFDPFRMQEPTTDEQLKKLRNATYVSLPNSAVTMDGFEWWLKKWLAQKEDEEMYVFNLEFNNIQAISFEDITNTLTDVIGKQEQCIEENVHRRSYWKIEILKNGKVGGTIKLFDDELYFESKR